MPWGTPLWLARLLKVVEPDSVPPIAGVALVQDGSFLGSREGSLLRRFSVTLPAGGAGTTNLVTIQIAPGWKLLIRDVRSSGSFLLGIGSGGAGATDGTLIDWVRDRPVEDPLTIQHDAVATGLVNAIDTVTIAPADVDAVFDSAHRAGLPAMAELRPGQVAVVADNNENAVFTVTITAHAIRGET